jgi:internalin A
MHSNQIALVPVSLERLPKLKQLDLRYNPLPISPEILSHPVFNQFPGPIAGIFNYLRQLRSGKVQAPKRSKAFAGWPGQRR